MSCCVSVSGNRGCPCSSPSPSIAASSITPPCASSDRVRADHQGLRHGGPSPLSPDELPLLHDQQLIRHMEEPVVVTDDHHGLTTPLQLGQDVVIEDLLEGRILIRRPLVEDIDVSVFEERH